MEANMQKEIAHNTEINSSIYDTKEYNNESIHITDESPSPPPPPDGFGLFNLALIPAPLIIMRQKSLN